MTTATAPMPRAAQRPTQSYVELSQDLGRSVVSLHRDNAAGRLPRPVRIGRLVRFIRSDVELWLSWGCPSRAEFEARKKAEGK